MDTAFFAGVTLDRSVWVKDGELVLVGCDFNVLDGNDAYDSEESTSWLPALGAATRMIVEDVAGYLNLDFVGWAVAMQLSAVEIGIAPGETVVDQWMKRRHRDCLSCLYLGNGL